MKLIVFTFFLSLPALAQHDFEVKTRHQFGSYTTRCETVAKVAVEKARKACQANNAKLVAWDFKCRMAFKKKEARVTGYCKY